MKRLFVLSSFMLHALFFGSVSYASSPGDEITGGFRFASPGFGKERRWKVEGDRVKFISEKIIELIPARAIVFGKDEPDYFIKADWARLNKVSKRVWTDGPVEVIKGDSRMTGIGMRWNPAKKHVKILSHVKMFLDLDQAKNFEMK